MASSPGRRRAAMHERNGGPAPREGEGSTLADHCGPAVHRGRGPRVSGDASRRARPGGRKGGVPTRPGRAMLCPGTTG